MKAAAARRSASRTRLASDPTHSASTSHHCVHICSFVSRRRAIDSTVALPTEPARPISPPSALRATSQASAFARVPALGQHQPRAGCRPSQRAKAWASSTASCRSRARSAKRKQPCMPLSHASCLLAHSTERTSCCACPRCGDTTRRSLARRRQPVSLPASWSGATRTAWTRCGCGGASGGVLTSEWGSTCGTPNCCQGLTQRCFWWGKSRDPAACLVRCVRRSRVACLVARASALAAGTGALCPPQCLASQRITRT
jgi:hypothetical protein